MTENKRFIDNGFEAIEEQSFTDTETDKTYYVDYFDEIIDLANGLNEKNKVLYKEIERLRTQNKNLMNSNAKNMELLGKENEQLKQLIKELEKRIHLIHMASMFSTVKSFKGDVSKRYEYSEETDTIYDTANTYGQYNKILDKKEVVMLLNEYETLLKGD